MSKGWPRKIQPTRRSAISHACGPVSSPDHHHQHRARADSEIRGGLAICTIISRRSQRSDRRRRGVDCGTKECRWLCANLPVCGVARSLRTQFFGISRTIPAQHTSKLDASQCEIPCTGAWLSAWFHTGASGVSLACDCTASGPRCDARQEGSRAERSLTPTLRPEL